MWGSHHLVKKGMEHVTFNPYLFPVFSPYVRSDSLVGEPGAVSQNYHQAASKTQNIRENAHDDSWRVTTLKNNPKSSRVVSS